MQNPQDVQLAASAFLARLPEAFAASLNVGTGIILGTGLSGITRTVESSSGSCRIPFADLPSFPQSSAPSHEGAFVAGILAGKPVLLQSGRFHLYEGYAPEQVCMGVRLMATLGIRTLIITNAAGSLNPLFNSGSLMCISDMINHTGISPLTGPNHEEWGPRFPDMSKVFDPLLQKLACRAALDHGIPLHRGIYLGVHGPELETPAETRMYRLWGADAVGMSTVLETICARHLGLKILAISCLTNQNLPDCMGNVSIEDIIAVSRNCAIQLEKLLTVIMPEICSGIMP